MRALLIAALLVAGCPKKVPPRAEGDAVDAWFGGSVGTPNICVPALVAAGPMPSRHAWDLGVEALGMGDIEGARAAFVDAGDHPSAMAGLAVVWLVGGEVERAVGTYEGLIGAFPDDVCLLHTGAFVALESGDSVTAKARVAKARALAPDLADTAWLEFALGMSDDPAAAEAGLIAFREAHPDQRLIEVTLASLNLQRGDLEGALPYLENLAAMGEPVDSYLLQVYRSLGRTDDLLRRYSIMGAPLGDDGRIAAAEDPSDVFYEVLGMHEGDRLVATIRTTHGTLTCELFPEAAPLTVANFVGLARGTIRWADPVTGVPRSDALYPNTGFHRVIPEFMIQGGDPNGDGSGGPGYQFVDEIDPALAFDKPGVLAMANSGADTNGSQWFVTEVPTEYLTGRHTIFGQCDAATVEVVKGIARVPVDEADEPLEPVHIEAIEIRAEARGPG